MGEQDKRAVHGSLPPKWKRKLFIDPIEALTDPIPEDEENHGGTSAESPSNSIPKKGDPDSMEDDIENQRRALNGSDASTSSNDPSNQEVDDENGKNEQKNARTVHLSETGGDLEPHSITRAREHGYLQDPTIPATSDTHSDHSSDSARSGVRSPTQHTEPGEEVVAASRTAKKERSSWDFKADDTFTFESGAPIPEPEKPPDPPPIFAPPFVRNKNDFRAKLMHLSELTLPLSPSGPEPELSGFPPNEFEQLQGASSQENVVGDQPPLTSRRKPPRPVARPKTRLQDPPPMTPAVSDQLANIWSDLGRSSRRGSTEDEAQTSRFGPVTGRRFSAAVTSTERDQMQNPMQSRLSRTGVIQTATDSTTIPTSEKPPEKTTSRLAMMSQSVMSSASRLGLLSKSKASIHQPPPPPPPPPDEEADPLDDDSIPRYKKFRVKQRRWLVWIQWIALLLLIVILILAIKLNKLQMVMWKEIELWQWLALATVVISGRLIAGWLVMILVAVIERHYILKKRVLYFVYGLRHAVKNVVWLALVIGVWKLVFRHVESKGNVPIVTKVLWCLFTSACLWMAKILAVKMAANTFHRAAYFDRVQDCLFHQYVLETLSAPRRYVTDQSGQVHGVAVEPTQPTQARQELEALLQPDVLDPDSSSEAPTAIQELLILGPPLPDPVLSSPETQESIDRALGAGRSNLGPIHERLASAEIRPESEKSSMASPKVSNLAAASQSRSNLRVSSRANLPHAQASQLLSPSGSSRQRRVSNADVQTSSILARSKSPIQQEKLQELTSETVSAWTMKRLMKMIRKTNIATFSSILDQEAGEKIDSEAQAKAAAKQIFYNIARPGQKFLTLTDFLYFLPEDQATRAFALFEVNDLGQINKKALMKWVVNIYKERRALALTLSDNRTVVAKLHRVLDVLLLAVAITICFLIMGVNTQKLIVGFSSVLLPAVFVFGNAARSTFESLIFLFVMHPFDVGDRISVDGSPMIVEEMNILNTIMLSGSNEKIYYPNSMLATKAISNYYRSPDQWDSIEFQIHATTPVEQLGLLKERMTKYIESLPQFWYPVFRIVCKDIEDSTRMKMALWVQHHLNYQESGERWQRRSNMILHMKTQLQDLGIGFHLPRQEITVTGVPVLDVPPNRSHATPM